MSTFTPPRPKPGDPVMLMHHNPSREQELLGAEFWTAATDAPGAVEFISMIQSVLFWDERHRVFHDTLREVISSKTLHGILADETDDCPLLVAMLAMLKARGHIDPLNLTYFEALVKESAFGTLAQCRQFAGELAPLYVCRWALAFAAEIISMVNAGVDHRTLTNFLTAKGAASVAFSDRIEALLDCTTSNPAKLYAPNDKPNQIAHVAT